MGKTPITPEVEIAALEAARRFYLKLHPLEKPDMMKSQPVIYWFFLLITVASAALAALRTGPVFFASANQTVPFGVAVAEAVLAVIAIDIAAAILAFFLVSENAKKQNVTHSLGKVIFSTLVFCLVIQIAANLYAVAGPVLFSTNAHKTAELVIAALVGLAAPIVAYISGHGLGVLHVQHQQSTKEQMTEYEFRRQQLWDAFEAWYDAKQRREWVARVQVDNPPVMISKPSVPALPSVSTASVTDSGRTDTGQTNGFAPRKANAQDMVFAYLDSHPDAANLPSRTLAQLIGVGHESANKYRNEWLSMQDVDA